MKFNEEEKPSLKKNTMKHLKKAVFTMVNNEKIRFPIWLKYYSRFFNKKDIYVLDYQCNDGTTENLDTNVIKISNETFSAEWYRNRVSEFQTKLLNTYDIVLFTEVDEIIVPNLLKYKNLDKYILKFEGKTVRCNGYEIFHLKSFEPPLNFKKPILEQRNFWYHSALYSKPLLSTIPLDWEIGFHNVKNSGYIDKDLYLIHLKRIDYEFCKKQAEERQKKKRDENDLKKGYGFQNRLIGLKFDEWFSSMSFASGPLELIPKMFKGLV